MTTGLFVGEAALGIPFV